MEGPGGQVRPGATEDVADRSAPVLIRQPLLKGTARRRSDATGKKEGHDTARGCHAVLVLVERAEEPSVKSKGGGKGQLGKVRRGMGRKGENLDESRMEGD
jgi:hypothetical protein